MNYVDHNSNNPELVLDKKVLGFEVRSQEEVETVMEDWIEPVGLLDLEVDTVVAEKDMDLVVE